MRLRPRRRNLVIWSSAGAPAALPAGRSSPRRTRIRRTRWWLRTGALLTIIGVLWLARTARRHWEPVFLLAGTALAMAGIMLPAVGAFFAGVLILIATLLKGIARNGRDTTQPAGRGRA